MLTTDQFGQAITALCAWREARGEGHTGLLAVICVMHNRAKAANKTLLEIVTAHNQFSSMTFAGDSQLVAWPKPSDAVLADILDIVDGVVTGKLDDITNGAQFYYNPVTATSTWFTTNIVGDSTNHPQTAQIGNHVFFK
jgi:spore germination cell wall hydrolase CwlJ-like protein